MSKLTIYKQGFGKNQRHVLKYGKDILGKFKTMEDANMIAKDYLCPPYTMCSNVWY